MTKQTLETLAENIEQQRAIATASGRTDIACVLEQIKRAVYKTADQQETAAALPGEGEVPHKHTWWLNTVEGWFCAECGVKGGKGDKPVEESPAVPSEPNWKAQCADQVRRKRQSHDILTAELADSNAAIKRLREDREQLKAELEVAKAKLARMTARTVDSQSLKGLMIEYHEDDNRWYVHKPDGHFVWSGEPFFNAWRCALQDEQIKELRAKFALSESSLAKAQAKIGELYAEIAAAKHADNGYATIAEERDKAHAEAAGMREANHEMATAILEDIQEKTAYDYILEQYPATKGDLVLSEWFEQLAGSVKLLNEKSDYVPRAKLAELRGLADGLAGYLDLALHYIKNPTVDGQKVVAVPSAEIALEKYAAYTTYTKEAQ